ncbi:hypothetical protein N7468_004214 [Penicillium chermesinum]|uniref:Programmed cell death protein 2 C-terminal domain-containing protein n=1 Tax=Penicillium chermesinum TaxID=63820 RepID=A0A9W9P8C7_9EURO|nr:uncharacterized protein N7468_004214 [Penicillium chermesinum]KAJ5239595.1 hypothetical protein N7468_004214 [Penicillium chermesinum]KAJ6166487.1 hypothetical protein N7470_001934 [Penicillium chermesinum]
MDPYDSDSSLDEDFTETSVTLGYASEEQYDDKISHLGGWPTWIDEKTPPPGEFANCKVCNNPMALLLELHGDLPDHFSINERRLYIFGCPRKPCNRKPGSIRAYRATRKVNLDSTQEEQKPEKAKPEATKPEKEAPKPKQDLGASLFGVTSLVGSVSANTNPFSTKPASSPSDNPFATPKPASNSTAPTDGLAASFADKVRLSSPETDPTAIKSSPPGAASKQTPESTGPQTPWPAQSAFPAPYKYFYLDADMEAMSNPSTPQVPENVTLEPMDEDGGGADLKDTFESELDKAFMKFSTRLAHNPEQVLRYEFRGSPLLYSYSDQVGKRFHAGHAAGKVTTVSAGGSIPPCEYCGAERVFEMQLVPHAISMLEEGREGVGLGKDDAGMEWGTIIVGVCAKDCAPEELYKVGWREEWAGVQWESQ